MEGRRIWPWNLHFQEAQCFGCKGPRDHTLRNTAQKRLGAQGKDRKWELPGNARPPEQVPLRGREAVGQMRDPLEESGRTAPWEKGTLMWVSRRCRAAGLVGGPEASRDHAPSCPTTGPAPTGEFSPTMSTSLLPRPGSAHGSKIAGGGRGPPQGSGEGSKDGCTGWVPCSVCPAQSQTGCLSVRPL